MVIPTHNCNRIVKSWSGPGTCETVYKTEDGRVWAQGWSAVMDYTNSGPARGVVRGGYICEEPKV